VDGSQATGDISLRGYWDPVPFLFLSLGTFTMYSCHDALPHYRHQSYKAKQAWAESTETVRQNKLFLIIGWLSQVSSDRELTDTVVFTESQ
jgi:hypothetical protein